MPNMIGSREEAQKHWYKEYYSNRGADRNDLRLNPGVLFQALAAEKAFICAIRNVAHNPRSAKVLDVGCGGGGDMFQLMRVGYLPENTSGIDIQQDRLDAAKKLYPGINFVLGDAAKMDFQDASFDLVFESTMFATLPDDELSARIADEMLRVTRPGGYLLLVDWWTPNPSDHNYKALTRSRLGKLFRLGQDTRVKAVCHGALVPPVGRFLSSKFPGAYFAVATLFPFLVGQVAYLLQKRPAGEHPAGAYYVAYSSEGGGGYPKLGDGLEFFWWRPGLGAYIPPTLGSIVVAWWLFHVLNIFKTTDYSVLYVRQGERIVHRSCIIPAYFRWPFMRANDLQVSSTWTDPAFRGKNLATIALQKIITDMKKPGRRFWYVSREENPSSISVAKKAGFTLFGYAARTKKFGTYLLGQLVLARENLAGK